MMMRVLYLKQQPSTLNPQPPLPSTINPQPFSTLNQPSSWLDAHDGVRQLMAPCTWRISNRICIIQLIGAESFPTAPFLPLWIPLPRRLALLRPSFLLPPLSLPQPSLPSPLSPLSPPAFLPHTCTSDVSIVFHAFLLDTAFRFPMVARAVWSLSLTVTNPNALCAASAHQLTGSLQFFILLAPLSSGKANSSPGTRGTRVWGCKIRLENHPQSTVGS